MNHGTGQEEARVGSCTFVEEGRSRSSGANLCEVQGIEGKRPRSAEVIGPPTWPDRFQAERKKA